MSKTIVVYHSGYGHTKRVAESVAEGAAAELLAIDAEGNLPEGGWEQLAAADAIIFGTPTRFGNVAAELKAFIDSLGGLWAKGKLVNKAGAVIVSTQTTHGGNETTALTLYAPMAHLGLVIVPAGYVDPVLFAAGTPYGASTVSGNGQPPTDNDVAAAKVHGGRVAKIAAAIKSTRG